jgi:transcriptional regulator GlxA family with amidase domain
MRAARDTARPALLDVTIVLVNEGYASTAVGPIEVFTAAGTMWDAMSGGTPEPRFRVTMASIDGAPVESAYGLRLAADAAIDEVEHADLVFVSASGPVPDEWMARHERLLPWLVERHRGGALVAGVCSGVAFLAEAGLLDGRRATTHWGVAESFRARYPRVDWRPDLLITEDGGLFCGGGVNAAKDLGLYLVDRLCGHETAVECAKALILDMPRVNQTGYATLPLSPPHRDAKVRAAEEYLGAHFRAGPAVDEVARHLGMSPRNFVRRFKAATGHLPGAYLQMLRVAAARQQLEDGAPSVERVARSVGYEDPAFFRRVFKRHVGLTPAHYRERFRLRYARGTAGAG